MDGEDTWQIVGTKGQMGVMNKKKAAVAAPKSKPVKVVSGQNAFDALRNDHSDDENAHIARKEEEQRERLRRRYEAMRPSAGKKASKPTDDGKRAKKKGKEEKFVEPVLDIPPAVAAKKAPVKTVKKEEAPAPKKVVAKFAREKFSEDLNKLRANNAKALFVALARAVQAADTAFVESDANPEDVGEIFENWLDEGLQKNMCKFVKEWFTEYNKTDEQFFTVGFDTLMMASVAKNPHFVVVAILENANVWSKTPRGMKKIMEINRWVLEENPALARCMWVGAVSPFLNDDKMSRDAINLAKAIVEVEVDDSVVEVPSELIVDNLRAFLCKINRFKDSKEVLDKVFNVREIYNEHCKTSTRPLFEGLYKVVKGEEKNVRIFAVMYDCLVVDITCLRNWHVPHKGAMARTVGLIDYICGNVKKNELDVESTLKTLQQMNVSNSKEKDKKLAKSCNERIEALRMFIKSPAEFRKQKNASKTAVELEPAVEAEEEKPVEGKKKKPAKKAVAENDESKKAKKGNTFMYSLCFMLWMVLHGVLMVNLVLMLTRIHTICEGAPQQEVCQSIASFKTTVRTWVDAHAAPVGRYYDLAAEQWMKYAFPIAVEANKKIDFVFGTKIIPFYDARVRPIVDNQIIPFFNEKVVPLYNEKVRPAVSKVVGAVHGFLKEKVVPVCNEVFAAVGKFMREKVLPVVVKAYEAVAAFVEGTVMPFYGKKVAPFVANLKDSIVKNFAAAKLYITTRFVPDMKRMVDTYVTPKVSYVAGIVKKYIEQAITYVTVSIIPSVRAAINKLLAHVAQVYDLVINYVKNTMLKEAARH